MFSSLMSRWITRGRAGKPGRRRTQPPGAAPSSSGAVPSRSRAVVQGLAFDPRHDVAQQPGGPAGIAKRRMFGCRKPAVARIWCRNRSATGAELPLDGVAARDCRCEASMPVIVPHSRLTPASALAHHSPDGRRRTAAHGKTVAVLVTASRIAAPNWVCHCWPASRLHSTHARSPRSPPSIGCSVGSTRDARR